MTLSRTDWGLVNKYLLFAEPTIWVEGNDDYAFCQPIVRRCGCRFERAGDKSACNMLAARVIKHNLPFVVVMDGDYDMLRRRRSRHRRVVMLDRYSIENYLFEKMPMQAVCMGYLLGQDGGLASAEFDALQRVISNTLRDLVVLAVAHQFGGTGHDVFDGRTRQALHSSDKILQHVGDIVAHCTRLTALCSPAHIAEARRLVDDYLVARRLVDLVPGHIVTEMIRQLVSRVVRANHKRPPNADNTTLLMLLVSNIWDSLPTADHVRLRRRLQAAIRDARRMRASAPAPQV